VGGAAHRLLLPPSLTFQKSIPVDCELIPRFREAYELNTVFFIRDSTGAHAAGFGVPPIFIKLVQADLPEFGQQTNSANYAHFIPFYRHLIFYVTYDEYQE
jgi:hypothetical protein